MELVLVLSHGPVIWAVEIVGINLDTGEEEDRVMLHSFNDIMMAKQYLAKLQQLTGLDIRSEVCDESDGFVPSANRGALIGGHHIDVVHIRESEANPMDSAEGGGAGGGFKAGI